MSSPQTLLPHVFVIVSMKMASLSVVISVFYTHSVLPPDLSINVCIIILSSIHSCYSGFLNQHDYIVCP